MLKLTPDFDEKSTKGFHMVFPNGYTVSVQIGVGNYCENQHKRFGEQVRGSETAEVWAWDDFGEFEPDPRGWQTMPEVLAYMNAVAALPKRQESALLPRKRNHGPTATGAVVVDDCDFLLGNLDPDDGMDF